MYPLSPEYMFVVLANVRAEVEADRLAGRVAQANPQPPARRRGVSRRPLPRSVAGEATATLAADRGR